MAKRAQNWRSLGGRYSDISIITDPTTGGVSASFANVWRFEDIAETRRSHYFRRTRDVEQIQTKPS